MPWRWPGSPPRCTNPLSWQAPATAVFKAPPPLSQSPLWIKVKPSDSGGFFLSPSRAIPFWWRCACSGRAFSGLSGRAGTDAKGLLASVNHASRRGVACSLCSPARFPAMASRNLDCRFPMQRLCSKLKKELIAPALNHGRGCHGEPASESTNTKL